MPDIKAAVFGEHDHHACVAEGLDHVVSCCEREGLRLTEVRRRVMEILLEDHRATGAYDVLERLREEGLGSQPPVVYRALDFLVDNGFVHKIHRLNAFVACAHPGEGHSPAFLICRDCRQVEEAHGASRQLVETAERTGFAIEKTTIEAIGLCPACQEAA
jgi:Fur family transcriptional regulator, zinc uptake regulator